MIQTTEFYNDFIAYYHKAALLQGRNEGLVLGDIKVDDPLMMNVHIYDCVERRQAGFSNILEDLHGKRSPKTLARLPKIRDDHDKLVMRFFHLFHRFTGSGASFEEDHGYRNSLIPHLLDNVLGEIDLSESSEDIMSHLVIYIADYSDKMVTSIGNQPPSLKNKDPEKYRLAMQYYFDNFAIDFIKDYSKYLVAYYYNCGGKMPIKKAVDFCCKWHKDRGFKQWKFVLTAFVMDDAEYYPEEVDPDSHCYFGANCLKAFELMFTKPQKKLNKQLWHDQCMEIIVKNTGGQPYSLEDVACDMIRYWTEYIPKKGYEHLSEDQKKNNSTLKVNGEYPKEIKERFQKVLGYDKV